MGSSHTVAKLSRKYGPLVWSHLFVAQSVHILWNMASGVISWLNIRDLAPLSCAQIGPPFIAISPWGHTGVSDL